MSLSSGLQYLLGSSHYKVRIWNTITFDIIRVFTFSFDIEDGFLTSSPHIFDDNDDDIFYVLGQGKNGHEVCSVSSGNIMHRPFIDQDAYRYITCKRKLLSFAGSKLFLLNLI